MPTVSRVFVACLLLTVLSGLAVPAVSTSCPSPSRTAVEQVDDSWAVFWSTPGCHSFVTTVDDDWSQRDERDVFLERPDDTSLYPADIEPAEDGGWWVLSDRGRIHKVNSSWGYEGPVVNLSVPGDWPTYTKGLERDQSGRWWVDAQEGVFVYGPEGGQPVYSLDQKATDIVVEDPTVTLLEDRRKGGRVVTYSIPPGWSPGENESIRRDATHELGPEVFHPRHLTRGDDGDWVVVSDPGNRFTYTADWTYTGQGPGTYATPTLLGGLFWLFPFLIVGWGAGALVGVAALFDRAPPALGGLGVFWPAVATVFALAIRQSAVPAALMVIYRVPDDTTGIALLSVVPVAALTGYYRRDDDHWRAKVFALLFVFSLLPLVAVAFDFLTSASVTP